ncbi:unnamed protein product [Sphagnum tenellum]
MITMALSLQQISSCFLHDLLLARSSCRNRSSSSSSSSSVSTTWHHLHSQLQLSALLSIPTFEATVVSADSAARPRSRLQVSGLWSETRHLRSGFALRSLFSEVGNSSQVLCVQEFAEVLESLREAIDLVGGKSEELEDELLLRFLKEHSLDVEEAAKAIAKHQKWRTSLMPQQPHEYILESEISGELNAKKLYMQGKDKRGHPILVMLGRNHVPNKEDFQEFQRFVVYAIEKTIKLAPADGKLVGIMDLKGYGFKNLDSQALITGFDIVQSHYPGCVEKLFMVNVPLIFYGVWKVASPFIKDAVRKKIVFVDNKKLQETLLHDIDADQLCSEKEAVNERRETFTNRLPPTHQQLLHVGGGLRFLLRSALAPVPDCGSWVEAGGVKGDWNPRIRSMVFIIMEVCSMEAHVLRNLSSGRFVDMGRQKLQAEQQHLQASKRSTWCIRTSRTVGNSACTTSLAAGSCGGQLGSLWKSWSKMQQNLLPRRIHATPGGEECDPKTRSSSLDSYDVREVIDTVVESETIDMPENAKEASAAPPPPLPGKLSPFSPGVDLDTDDTSHADHQ